MIISFRVKVLLSLLAIEVLGFGTWYLVSDGGLREALLLKRECGEVEKKIAVLRSDIDHIQNDFVIWRDEPFFVEQYAREKLAMSRPGDEVLFIDE